MFERTKPKYLWVNSKQALRGQRGEIGKMGNTRTSRKRLVIASGNNTYKSSQLGQKVLTGYSEEKRNTMHCRKFYHEHYLGLPVTILCPLRSEL